MLNVVVSQKASARNVYRSKMLSGQKLWFVIEKQSYSLSTGRKRSAEEMHESTRDYYFQLKPWTESYADIPRPKDLDKLQVPLKKYRDCLIYVGRVAESSFNDMPDVKTIPQYIDMKKLELFVKI